MEMLNHQDDLVIIEECCTNLTVGLQDVTRRIKGLAFKLFEDDTALLSLQKGTDRLLDSTKTLGKKLSKWQNRTEELKTENKLLKLENQDLQLNITAKNRCIDAYKQKLSSQFVQIQNLSSENSMTLASPNLLKESERFRNEICQKLLANRNNDKIVPDTEIKEVEYPDNPVISAGGKAIIYQSETFHSDRDDLERIYSSKLREMEEKNSKLKDLMNKLQIDCDESNKATAKLEAECLVFKKSFDQTNSVIEVFENIKKQLCDKLVVSIEQKKSKNEKILELMKDVDKLKEEVLKLKQEREHVDGMAFKISEKFGDMKMIQEKLKETLKNKDERLALMEEERLKLIGECKQYRSLEFEDKKRIQELLQDVKHLQEQKQEMTALHYEELCDANGKLKQLEMKLGENVGEKRSIIENLIEIKSILSSKMESKHDVFGLLKDILGELKARNEIYCRFKNRLKLLQVRSERLSLTTSKNVELLRGLDFHELVGRTKRLLILAEVKRQEKLQIKKRFEKHQHVLLVQVKKYKKSHQLAQENCGYFQNLCEILRSDLELARKVESPGDSGCFERDVMVVEEKSQLEVLNDIDKMASQDLSEQLEHKNCLLEEYSREMNVLKNDIKLLQSRFEQETKLCKRMKVENSYLEEGLRKREELLGKVFVNFKTKIQDALDEANDKYFLQRLCSDLKFALKVLLGQDKMVKGSMEEVTVINTIRTPVRYSEKYIQSLLKKQKDTSLTDSFEDLQSYVDSLKKGMSLLHTVMLEK